MPIDREHQGRVRSAGPYLLVFDTTPGTAKAVAVALKSAAWPEVRGVVGEDEVGELWVGFP